MMVSSNAAKLTCVSCASFSRCIFSAVEPKVLKDLLSSFHWVRFEKGETIIHEGAPITGWVILCQGQAKLMLSTEHGKRLLLQLCRSGDFLSLSLSKFFSVSRRSLLPVVSWDLSLLRTF